MSLLMMFLSSHTIMVSYVTRSFQVMPRMRLRLVVWKASSFLMWRRYGVHVSELYSTVEKHTARYTAALVFILRLLLLKTLLHNLPKAAEAELIRESISASRLQSWAIVLPRYLNFSTAAQP